MSLPNKLPAKMFISFGIRCFDELRENLEMRLLHSHRIARYGAVL
jgi:hypothetical protein